MDPKSIYEYLKNRFGEAVLSFHEPTPVPVERKDTPEIIEWKKALDEKRKLEDSFCFVKAESLVEIMRFLRDDRELKMDFLMCLSGVDTKGPLQVVYHLFSYPLRHKFIVKVEVPREEPKVPSVVALYPVADMQEREAYDLYGIEFLGHPNLRRILLPDEWPGHPMRKDWKEPPEVLGIATTRENPLVMLGAFNQYKAEQEAQKAQNSPEGDPAN